MFDDVFNCKDVELGRVFTMEYLISKKNTLQSIENYFRNRPPTTTMSHYAAGYSKGHSRYLRRKRKAGPGTTSGRADIEGDAGEVHVQQDVGIEGGAGAAIEVNVQTDQGRAHETDRESTNFTGSK